MITATLKTILTESGCTLVIYEQSRLANLYTDQSDQDDIIGVISQLDSMILENKANAIMEHYNPLYIEVSKQVSMQDQADNNEVVFQQLLEICKQIVVRIIGEATFKIGSPIVTNKIPESKYDANVLGWIMTLDIQYLNNENKTPCLTSP